MRDGNEETEVAEGTDLTRRNGETEGSIDRRAKHADSRDVREQKYKPPVHSVAVCIFALVHHGRPPSAANRTASHFVCFVPYVVYLQSSVFLRSLRSSCETVS